MRRRKAAKAAAATAAAESKVGSDSETIGASADKARSNSKDGLPGPPGPPGQVSHRSGPRDAVVVAVPVKRPRAWSVEEGEELEEGEEAEEE